MKVNIKAAELRTKLFDLVNAFKDLSIQAHNESKWDAYQEIDDAACKLAGIYEKLPDVFTDAYQDAKDQRY